jgi:molecular chaperone Hsp33
MFADGIKFNGAVNLHCQGDGPLTMLMAKCRSQHLLRAIARWDPQLAPVESVPMNELLGNGQLAISLLSDPADAGRSVSYQGLISLGIGGKDFSLCKEVVTLMSDRSLQKLTPF